MLLKLAIIIFCLLFVVVAFLYRNSTLDKLPLLAGEKILFEENGIRVEQGGAPRSVIFINCIVRVTDRRIIIAQKMLLSKKYALRHVIFYNSSSYATDLKTTLKQGYLNITVKKSDVMVSGEKETAVIRIDIPGSALTGNQYILFKTLREKDYSAIL